MHFLENYAGRSVRDDMPAITPTHYLRVEGVNLARFVFDTRDLSTIRGGGLLLLEAAKSTAKSLLASRASHEVEEISVGASIGLFAFTPKVGLEIEAIREEITRELQTKERLRHATFVVDIEPASTQSGPFRDCLERLLAKNRWRQYQAATLSIPETPPDCPPGKSACQFDAIRPASSKLFRHSRPNTFLSPSTHARRKYGQEQKKEIYQSLTKVPTENFDGVKLGLDTARHFQEIAEPNPGEHLRLANKMAVFYADGNQFSKIGQRLCTTQARQQAWDGFLQEKRRQWLTSFLTDELTRDHGVGWIYEIPKKERKEGAVREGRYRFETLLWGGDEMLFVVPAWMGWRFAHHFFKAVETWNARDAAICPGQAGQDTKLFPDTPLTHTAALIFCHHHSPIHRIKDLAKEKMVEFAKGLKNAHGDKIGRSRNQLVYLVLESFDHLGADYRAGLRQRTGACCRDIGELVIAGTPEQDLAAKIALIGEAIAALQATDFPRSQLRAWATEFIKGPAASQPWEVHDQKTHESALGKVGCDEKIRLQLAKLRECFPSNGAFWLHLEELWDYARP